VTISLIFRPRMQVAMLVLASAMALLPSDAQSDGLAGDPARLRLPTDSTRTSFGTTMRIQGLPLRAEVFQTSASLRETADLIASQADVLPSLLVQPGSLLLTWQSGAHHWMARLTQSAQALTHGTVSVLTLPDVKAAIPTDYSVKSDWLPDRARLLFTFASGEGTRREQQHVYTHDMPPSRLWQHIRPRLRRAGWHPALGADAHGEVKRWIRGAHTLSLLVVPMSEGSGMLLVESGAM